MFDLLNSSFDFSYMKNYQVEIWGNILGRRIEPNKRFKNPLRIDKSAGAILKYKDGFLFLLDTPSEYHGLHCFSVLCKIYNCSYYESFYKAYELLKGNTLIKKDKKVKKIKSVPTLIKIIKDKWNSKDKDFWGIGNITSLQLIKEECFPTLKYWVSKEGLPYEMYIPKIRVYANFLRNKVKLYGPEKRLFITNFTRECIGGLSPYKNKELLIVTVNFKSYLCLINLGYNCRYVPSEGIILPEWFVKECKEFDMIVFLMDNDQAGKNYIKKLEELYVKEFKCKGVHFDIEGNYTDAFGNIKPLSDPYDITFKYDLKELNNQLKRIL